MSSQEALEPVPGATPSESITLTIADYEGLEPTDLTPVLYDVIDPDALDRILERSNQTVEVSFDYCDWRITASSDDSITITESVDKRPRTNGPRPATATE